MSTIYLVRHGQASFGAADYDVLSERGQQQARVLGDAFARAKPRLHAVVSGDMQRHRQTARACLAEIGLTGPVTLPNGETRKWIQDGDEIVFRARAEAPGAVPIGFGECRGVLNPAIAWPA